MSTTERRPGPASIPSASAAVNEWGMYDPAVAGIEALFARVDPDGRRRERAPRHSSPRRSRRTKDRDEARGVGLAVSEAMARARRTSALALSHAEATEELTITAAQVPAGRSRAARPDIAPNATCHHARQPRSRPAIWMRAAEAVEPRSESDSVHGIFETLAIPATVALVQYARGCRSGAIHVSNR
jgi:hypothetical protein